jgi:hypothetical protein
MHPIYSTAQHQTNWRVGLYVSTTVPLVPHAHDDDFFGKPSTTNIGRKTEYNDLLIA